MVASTRSELKGQVFMDTFVWDEPTGNVKKLKKEAGMIVRLSGNFLIDQ